MLPRIAVLEFDLELRRSRGLDISAACGQLRVELEARHKIATEQHGHVD